ncbi:MAG: hypothetical protein KA712_00855 [Myxococcales bacterium]|nr:hypothetical protein [Myxococcales bacterium]
MDPGDEVIPLTVEFDAAELQQGLCTVSNPAHATLVEAQPDEVADGTLDHAGGKLEVSRAAGWDTANRH